MAVDAKYGRVTLEHGGHIPDDEPVFVFRAQDKLTPSVLEYYAGLCEAAGSPQRHIDLIESGRFKVVAWQADHAPRVPDSESSRERLP